jgi:hypothetical protein
VGTARNAGVSTETSVRRLCPPYGANFQRLADTP